MGKGSIKIASTQNATRQLNWLPTYTLFENLNMINFNSVTEQYSRYGTINKRPLMKYILKPSTSVKLASTLDKGKTI